MSCFFLLFTVLYKLYGHNSANIYTLSTLRNIFIPSQSDAVINVSCYCCKLPITGHSRSRALFVYLTVCVKPKKGKILDVLLNEADCGLARAQLKPNKLGQSGGLPVVK